jgi:hypothetical protein
MKFSIQLKYLVLSLVLAFTISLESYGTTTAGSDSMIISREDGKILHIIGSGDQIVLEHGFWTSTGGQFVKLENDSIFVSLGKWQYGYALNNIKAIGLYGGSRTQATFGQTLGYIGSLGMAMAATSTIYDAVGVFDLKKNNVQRDLYLFIGSSIVLTAGRKLAQYERLKLKKGKWRVLQQPLQ